MNSITTSQMRLTSLKNSLVEAEADLSTTKPELKALATQSQEFDEMLLVLGHM